MEIQYYAYTLNKDYKAPFAAAKTQAELQFKQYLKGDVVKGYEYASRPEDGIVPLVILDEEWAVPSQFLIKGDKWGVNQTGADKKIDPKKISSEIKNDLKQIAKGTYGSMRRSLGESTVKGLLFGAAAGFVAAWLLRSPSKVWFILGGTVLGGIVGNKYGKKKVEMQQNLSAENK